MNIEWLINKAKEKFYPITHAKAVLYGDSNDTVDKVLNTVESNITDIGNELDGHVNDTGNPHNVTASQAAYDNTDSGLSAGNVQDAIDAVKSSVSTAESTLTTNLNSEITRAKEAENTNAVNLSSHTNNKSNPHEVTKAQVGLGNVEDKSSATIRGEITKSNVTTALGYTPLNQSLKGSASGLAELDSNGKVPSQQLPSYVDDVIEGYLSGGKFYKESSHTTEIIGETGKIYVDLSTEKTYRWSGSAFVVISETLALGETSETAYRGDRGKTAYDHSQTTHARTDATKVEKSSKNGNIKINGTETNVYTHPSGTNPHGTTKADVGLGNVGNFKAVSTVASQGLSDTEKANARANIGAGTSSFSGSYNDLSNKPTIPTNNNQLTNGAGYITSSGTAKTISDTLPISKGGTGQTTGENATNALINSLGEGTDTPSDNDYYISQYANGGTTHRTYYRRPVSALWNYIKSKLAKVATSGSYNDLTNKPTIPTVGNGTVTIKQAGASKGTFTMNQSGNTTIELTDNNTDTWRGIQNNLTSTSTTDSLSAAQGKVLNDTKVGFAKVSASRIAETNNNPFFGNVEDEDIGIGSGYYYSVINLGSYSQRNHRSQIAMPYQSDLADSDMYIRTDNNGTWRPWRKVIHSGNIGSQSVNYANSAGNADTLDGNHASAFATANHKQAYTAVECVEYSTDDNTIGVTPAAVKKAITEVFEPKSHTHSNYLTGITKTMVTNALGYTPPTTDTWRGIQNNLTSDSTTDSLSAAQGKVLKGLVDGKAASNHTHSQYLTSHQDISGKFNKSGDTITGGTIAMSKTGLPTLNGSVVGASNVAIGKNGIGIGGIDTSNDGAAIFMENGGTETNRLIISLGDDATQNGEQDYIAFRYYDTAGNVTYESKVPSKSGTIALTSDIPTIPSSLPANGGNSATVNGHTVNSDVPANAKFTDTNTWRPLGTTADTACAGNDSRLSNARPASDVYSWAKASSKPSYSWGEIGSKPSYADQLSLSGNTLCSKNNLGAPNGFIDGISFYRGDFNSVTANIVRASSNLIVDKNGTIKLGDYYVYAEEPGTWSPSNTVGGPTDTSVYDFSDSKYIKIGNVVILTTIASPTNYESKDDYLVITKDSFPFPLRRIISAYSTDIQGNASIGARSGFGNTLSFGKYNFAGASGGVTDVFVSIIYSL